MLKRFLNIFRTPDLRNRILAVLGLLVFFRLLSAIVLPDVDVESLRAFYENNRLLGLWSTFSGGSLDQISVAMLGVGPYITATIIMQLLTMIFPSLKAMYYEDGSIGRAKFNRISRLITVPLAVLQTFGFLKLLGSQGVVPPMGVFSPELWTNITVATAGTMILLWIGELIDERKIGNGVSLIIFAGIVAALPNRVLSTVQKFSEGSLTMDTIAVFAALIVLIVSGVVFVSQGERRIPVSYPKRIRGTRVMGGVESYLPIKVTQAGVIPIIFAIALLSLPQMIGSMLVAAAPAVGVVINEFITKVLNNQFIYGSFYFFLVFAFTYFYTAIVFDPAEISKNLQRSGGFVPGIRPGEPTSKFLGSIIGKTTLFGALFLSVIAVLPLITQAFLNQNFALGGTTLLIVVSVAIDSMNQIDSQLKVREYEV